MAGAPSPDAAQISIAASSLFPGFRFSPTDQELISYYLKNKMLASQTSVEVIPEIEIWRYEPWDLPAKSIIPSENEWFFFSPCVRKYPNGSQSRRATELGYWKATGKERNVKSGSNFIGTKRTLVFHIGRAPKGERTEWIMHEYSMLDKSQDFMVVCRVKRNTEFHLRDGANRASSSQRPLSTVHNNTASEAGTEQDEKAAECSSKKCSHSYSSYSIEQNDSTSESNQKPALEVTQPDCSGDQKEYEDEDDFFADILKDDIIKLDEPSTSGALSMKDDIIKLDEPSTSGALSISQMAPSVPEDEQKSHQPSGVVSSQGFPLQGTANRRIRLKKECVRTNHIGGIDITKSTENALFIRRYKTLMPEPSLKRSTCVLSSARKTVSQYRVIIAMLLLAFMALFVSLLGGFWRVRRIIFQSFYNGFLR